MSTEAARRLSPSYDPATSRPDTTERTLALDRVDARSAFAKRRRRSLAVSSTTGEPRLRPGRRRATSACPSLGRVHLLERGLARPQVHFAGEQADEHHAASIGIDEQRQAVALDSRRRACGMSDRSCSAAARMPSAVPPSNVVVQASPAVLPDLLPERLQSGNTISPRPGDQELGRVSTTQARLPVRVIPAAKPVPMHCAAWAAVTDELRWRERRRADCRLSTMAALRSTSDGAAHSAIHQPPTAVALPS
jgi:hypothetical protein